MRGCISLSWAGGTVVSGHNKGQTLSVSVGSSVKGDDMKKRRSRDAKGNKRRTQSIEIELSTAGARSEPT